MNKKPSLKGVTWGSPEFFKVMNTVTPADDIYEDKKRIDNLLRKIKTSEGYQYLINVVLEECHG